MIITQKMLHVDGAQGPLQQSVSLYAYHLTKNLCLEFDWYQGKDLIIANLGDSRAVLATMSGAGYLKAVQLTTDQKPGLPGE